MKVPPEIVFKGVESTPHIEQLIARGLAGLERVFANIVSTRIAVERAQGRRQKGDPYRMRIDIRIPGRSDIVVKRWSKALTKTADGIAKVQTDLALEGEPEPETTRPIRRSPVPRRGVREEPLEALIRRSFDSARRELEKVVDKQSGDVKTPAQQQALAFVDKVFRDRDYGFLRTQEGEQVYFHRNSVIHDHWEGLKVGTAVRYAAALGEKGLQATTVDPVERPGAAEIHDQLHDMPPILPPPRRRKPAPAHK